jgi:DNA-binding IclR family transcriptional regulator
VCAIDDKEQVLGVRGVAAPVRDHRGQAVAALGVAASSLPLTRDRLPTYVSLVRRAP